MNEKILYQIYKIPKKKSSKRLNILNYKTEPQKRDFPANSELSGAWQRVSLSAGLGC